MFELYKNLIEVRKSDGYINATKLCKIEQREFKTYYRSNKFKKFLMTLSSEVQICTSALVSMEKSFLKDQSTFVHPMIAINICQWISPEFDVKVSKYIYELVLFGEIKLNKEKTYEELEFELKKQQEKYTILDKKYEEISDENKTLIKLYKNLKKNHNNILRKKSVHYFKKGKCFYIVSNPLENATRVKIGISLEINKRLTEHRVTMPFLVVHYLVFCDDYDLIEKIMKKHYEKELNPNNHEFISNIPINDLITKSREILQILNCDYTETSEKEIEKYNLERQCTSKDIEIIVEEKKKRQKITTEIFIKKCPGKFHDTENSRLMECIMFFKNRATKDGYSVYCKQCVSKMRLKNPLSKVKLEYDKNTYKWCPGPSHSTEESRIVEKLDFHKNKNGHDNLSPYCKECIGEIKYGKDRKRIKQYLKPPKGIDIDKQKWCSDCEQVLERIYFHKSSISNNGLQNQCIDCRKKKRNYK